MRPKSIATVVVDFSSTPVVSSTPTLASVSNSSVRSGRISLTAPTNVVLPAPKPPAISIFTATGSSSAGPMRLERTETTDHRLKYGLAGQLGRPARLADQDETAVEQVTEEDPDDAHGE